MTLSFEKFEKRVSLSIRKKTQNLIKKLLCFILLLYLLLLANSLLLSTWSFRGNTISETQLNYIKTAVTWERYCLPQHQMSSLSISLVLPFAVFWLPSTKFQDITGSPLWISMELLKLFQASNHFLQPHVPHGTGSSKGKEKPRVEHHPASYQNLCFVWGLHLHLMKWQMKHSILHFDFNFRLIYLWSYSSSIISGSIFSITSQLHQLCQYSMLTYLAPCQLSLP